MDQSERKSILKQLIETILSGKFDLYNNPLDKVYLKQSPVRQEYISPRDRSGYNYGYMTSGEIGAHDIGDI